MKPLYSTWRFRVSLFSSIQDTGCGSRFSGLLVDSLSLHMTGHNSLCKLAVGSAHYTVQTIYCTLQITQYILHTTNYSVHISHYILHTQNLTLQIAQYKMNSTNCKIQIAQTLQNCTLTTAHYNLHPTTCTLQTANYTLNTINPTTLYKLLSVFYISSVYILFPLHCWGLHKKFCYRN